MINRLFLICGIFFGVANFALNPLSAETIRVFAASSLQNVLEDISSTYEKESKNSVSISFAGSPTLARQIKAYAPADIFISANVLWMNILEEDGLIAPQSRFNWAGNRLVLVAHQVNREKVFSEQQTVSEITSQLDIGKLLGPNGHLAMAFIDTVPVGIYGKEALEYLGQWDNVKTRVVEFDSAAAVVRQLSAGELGYGIIYESDALHAQNVRIVGVFPPQSHVEILYPVAAIKPYDKPEVRAFIAYLKSPMVQKQLSRYGFRVIKVLQ